MAFALGATALGAEALTSTLTRNPPTVVATAPTGAVQTTTTTATWTYNSAISRPQTGYRLILMSGGDVLFDTGLVAGAVTTAPIGFTLSPFTTYLLWVGVSDGLDGAGDPYGEDGTWDSTEFSTTSLIVEHEPNLSVGQVYEIGINSVGYMLADTPDRPIKRQTAHLQADRFATGDTPFSEAIDRYTQASHSDWTSGDGQLFLRRPGADTSRYFYSEGVNPFEPGEITCLREQSLLVSDTYSGQRITVASGIVFFQTDASQLTGLPTPEGAATAFSTGLAGALQDLATDGTYWYATDGATVRRNNTTTNPGADWSTVDVTQIGWIGDRIGALDTVTGPNFTTLGPTGLEENAGGWQTFTGRTLRGITGGDGYAWFGSNGVDTGHVRAWQLDSGAGSTFIGLSLPQGERVDGLFFYLGNVFVSAWTSSQVKIYRCAASEGLLTPELVHQRPIVSAEAGSPYVRFAGVDRFVAFSWVGMERDGSNGIGVVDLTTGGVARWYSDQSGATKSAVVPTVWRDDFVFTVNTLGLYGPGDDDPALVDLRDGFLETSVDDLATTLTKMVVEVGLVTRPLVGTVEVSMSDNSNATFVPIAVMSGVGATNWTVELERQLKSFGIRVDLVPVGADGPSISLITTKLHPMGLIDQIVTVPVKCSDRLKGLNGVELPESEPGLAMSQIRELEGLVGEIVTFQDIDWVRTQTSVRCMIVDAEVVELVGTYDVNQGQRVNQGVVAVTLRRSVG